ncbi:uncharacterized protein LOC115421806 isoform X2 [Sphaeramia orbicularis]|nr:uncharacterized protein LOC115421806 isoform X2 [Sphaeramia orbicularis]
MQMQNILTAIEHIKSKTKTPIVGTYTHLTDASVQKLPIMFLTVSGKDIAFIVDYGATCSVIKQCDLPDVKLSGRHVISIGASGMRVREKFTTPIACVHSDPMTKIKHSFLLSSCCPFNLLGRDLMLTLGIDLISTPEGVKAIRGPLEPPSIYSMLKYPDTHTLFVYQWWIPLSPADMFTDRAHVLVSPNADFMRSENLHCTFHVSTHPDEEYEEDFLTELNDDMITDSLYWSEMHSAITVVLTSTQLEYYKIPGSIPHISLSKKQTHQWRDLGPWVKSCASLVDWTVTTDPNVLYSPSAHVYKTKWRTISPVLHSVYVLCTDSDTENAHTLLTATDVHPALGIIPDSLWAKGKYDVGLIRNREPVVVTPKSDYRPKRPQYPLRKEAAEGIKPVFESLLQAGVIIPCDDSPVCTPIFPVQKYREPPANPEWRFVQDLKPVNAAIHARTPNVPNPYTILTQVPSTSKWFSVVDLSNAFFSVSVDPDSQFWFVFQFDGKGYTFTRLPQGYAESPTIYNATLCASLAPLKLTDNTALLQYVDDLLLCAPTEEQCTTDTIMLLKHLAKEGHKADLLDAILLPTQIAVCKCVAHTNFSDPVSIGNARVDAAEKAACCLPLPQQLAEADVTCFLSLPSSLSAVQSLASDKHQWKTAGATFDTGMWVGPNGKPCLPSALFSHYAKLTHGLDHVSKGGMQEMINQNWFTKGFSAYAQKHCQAYVICASHNPGRSIQITQQAAHPPPIRPFEHVMMDFIELTPSEGKKYCLVMVDMWSKWVEAFPASKSTA